MSSVDARSFGPNQRQVCRMATLLQPPSTPAAQRRRLRQYISIAGDGTCSFAARSQPIHLLPRWCAGPRSARCNCQPSDRLRGDRGAKSLPHEARGRVQADGPCACHDHLPQAPHTLDRAASRRSGMCMGTGPAKQAVPATFGKPDARRATRKMPDAPKPACTKLKL
jgi:hypothetical protein